MRGYSDCGRKLGSSMAAPFGRGCVDTGGSSANLSPDDWDLGNGGRGFDKERATLDGGSLLIR